MRTRGPRGSRPNDESTQAVDGPAAATEDARPADDGVDGIQDELTAVDVRRHSAVAWGSPVRRRLAVHPQEDDG